MSALADWLTVQVDKDQAMAQAVLTSCRDTRLPWPPEQASGHGGPVLTAYLRHFSENRQLREVAAKRALLHEYQRLLRRLAEHNERAAALAAEIEHENRTGEWSGPGDPGTLRRGMLREDDYLTAMLPVLRGAVVAMAAVYQDRPGYQEAISGA